MVFPCGEQQEHAPGKARAKCVSNRPRLMMKTLLPLDGPTLCRNAQRRTGLKDFGSPRLEPAISTLVQSLDQEAQLHPLGRFLMRIHLRGLLETRLRLVEARKPIDRLPEQRIKKPIFIVGVPRSGSTYLHELLAQNPGWRAPRVWEVMFPVRHQENDANDVRRRVRKASLCLWCFRMLAPQADAVYPMRARTPHECVAIHSYTLLSQEFISTARIPTYESFLRSTDLTQVYEWQKRFLQHLQLGCPIRRWVLKAPDHVYSLKELFSVFPDAVIIQTHRNPLEVLRSSIQLTEVLYNLFAWPGNRDELAEREATILARSMESFIRFRDEHPEMAGRFIDLNYSELVADPLAAVRRVYQQLEAPLTEEAARRIRELVSKRSRYQKSQIPTLAEFGVDVIREARRFSQYCFRFGVPCQ